MTNELDPRAAGGKRLKDKVCVVTGAGQGIGRSTAKRLGAEGGIIVVADRVDEGATQTIAELKEHGVETLPPESYAAINSLTLPGAKNSAGEIVPAHICMNASMAFRLPWIDARSCRISGDGGSSFARSQVNSYIGSTCS